MPVGKKRASPPTSLRSQRHVQLQGPRSRRAMLRAARAFRDTGAPSPGVENPDLFRTARAGFFVEEPDVDWEEAYEKQVEAAVRAADYVKHAAE